MLTIDRDWLVGGGARVPVRRLGLTVAAFALWFNGIRRLPTQAPPVLGLAAPITGAALGWIILNEDLTTIQMVGFAITIAAITYAATIGARPAITRARAPSGHRHLTQPCTP